MTSIAIDADGADIPAVSFNANSSDPTAPGAGKIKLYLKDGLPYIRTSSAGPYQLVVAGGPTPLGVVVEDGTGYVGKLEPPSASQYLRSNAVTKHLEWASVSPGGGMTNPMTAAGSLIVGNTGGAPAELAAGSDGQVLTVDVSTHLPAWATPSSGQDHIAKTVVGVGGVGSVTFSNIPQTFSVLQIDCLARGSLSGTDTQICIRFNGDTGNNYDDTIWYCFDYMGNTSAKGASYARIGGLTGTGSTAGNAAASRISIPAYAETVFRKSFIGHSACKKNDADGEGALQFSGAWRNTAAITSITLLPTSGNFLEGSSFVLNGLP